MTRDLETAEEYLEWILTRMPKRRVSERQVASAHGCVLAADVRALIDVPLWDASAMDGYAVRASDIVDASVEQPVALEIIAEVAAGSDLDPPLLFATAARIMTGAPVPTASDAVVPVEQTRGENGAVWAERTVAVQAASRPGANIRRQGEDVRMGDIVGRAGQRIDAVLLSALIAAGITTIPVVQKPRIAVMSTGSELAPPGVPLTRGSIPESNTHLLVGLLSEMGCVPMTVAHSGDDATTLATRLRELATNHDVVITTGGVGPGVHDVVRIALETEPEIRAARVAVKPGQPQCSGRHSAGAFIFGLPGNPVSAAVSFELFVRPALKHANGAERIHRRRRNAIVIEGWTGRQGRLQVQPVTLTESEGELACRPAVSASAVSHSVARHGRTEGYALIEPACGDVRTGDTVTVIETGWA